MTNKQKALYSLGRGGVKNKNMYEENKNKNNDFSDFEDESEEEQVDFIEKNSSDNDEEDFVKIPKAKIKLIKQMSENIKESNNRLLDLLSSYSINDDLSRIGIGQLADAGFSKKEDNNEPNKIIEGVFDGENMIGPDGKQYSVPSNYASKSKLVEGDIMKLTITDGGIFVYKQIESINRKRVIGVLNKTSDNNYIVEAEGKTWRVLNASVTYFKGSVGDEVVLLFPEMGESKWGAVENIVKQGQ